MNSTKKRSTNNLLEIIQFQTPPTPALRLCIIKPTGFSGLFRECNPCFSGHYRLFPLKKANLLNDALVERRSWRGLSLHMENATIGLEQPAHSCEGCARCLSCTQPLAPLSGRFLEE